MWKKLNAIKSKFGTAEASFEFFKEHQKYFMLHSFNDESLKFSQREDDKTSSTLAKPQLVSIDFGAEARQKPIQNLIMDAENKRGKDMDYDKWADQKEAIDILAKLLNVENNNFENFEYEYTKVEKVIAPAINPNQLKRFQKNAEKHEEVFNILCKDLLRSCNQKEIKKVVKDYKIGLNDYMQVNTLTNMEETVYRVFIPEFDAKEIAWSSYRYNRNLKVKGLKRKDSKKVLIGSHLLHTFKDGPIIFSEGHSDVLVNTAKSLRCITAGSAINKIIDIELLAKKELHFFPDNDLPGLKGIVNKLIQVYNFNKENKENEIKTKVIMFTSAVTFDIQEEIKEAIRKLKVSNKEKHNIYNFINPDNFIYLSKNEKKKGYDFVDFHLEHQNTANYNNLLKIYKNI